MAKNLQWSISDMQKKGLVQNSSGDFVPVKSLVAKNPIKIIIDQSGPAFDKVYLQKRIDELNAQDAFDGSNFKKNQIDEYGLMERINPKEIFNAYKETRLMFFESIPRETFQLPDGGYIDVLYSFDIDPVSAPRMTVSDKWKLDPNHIDPLKRQRRPVTKYFAYKTRLRELCALNGYKLTPVLRILCIVPMPKSWSKNKMLEMNNKPHQQRGDWDNIGKGFCDCLSDEDNFVWDGRVIKLWGYVGRIIVF